MPEPDYFIKTRDTGSSIRTTLENSAGSPVDIQGATVLFKLAPIAGGTLTVAGTATILQVGAGTGAGGSMGQVSFAWPSGGIPAAGLYLGEWETTYSSGTVQTFPNDGYNRLLVTGDL